MAPEGIEAPVGKDIVRDIIAIIAEKKEIDPSSIALDTKLTDLGFDSFDVIEFIFAVEQRFDIDVPYNPSDADALEFDTVSQVVGAVEKVVTEQRAAD